jgi:hypothetical protein
MIEKAGGGSLEDHLNYAMEIMRANANCHRAIWNAASENWVREEGESTWSGTDSDKLNLDLLDGPKIKEIWRLYHP